MKKILVILVSLHTFFPICAQNDFSEAKKLPFWAVNYNKLCDKYNALLYRYKQLDSLYRDTLNYYEERESAFVEASQTLKKERESIQPTLDQIRLDREQIAREKASLDKQIANRDRTIAQYCDLKLQLRYKKDEVEDALELWNTITSPDVKEEFFGVDVMLENYYRYYKEVRSVIQDAQDDEFRKDTSPLSTYRRDMESKMENTEYYRNRDYDKGYFILFLDQQVDIFFYCLKKQKRGEYDFSLILDYLYPKVD